MMAIVPPFISREGCGTWSAKGEIHRLRPHVLGRYAEVVAQFRPDSGGSNTIGRFGPAELPPGAATGWSGSPAAEGAAGGRLGQGDAVLPREGPFLASRQR